MNNATPWLSLNEAAEYLKTSRETLQRRVKDGSLTHGRVGTSIKFRIEDLDAWVMSQGKQAVDA